MLPALLLACVLGDLSAAGEPCRTSASVLAKPLAHAFRDGDISVKATSFAGYSIAALEIRNRRSRDIRLDVNGSYLEPRARSIQPLGLGLTHAGSGDTTVDLGSLEAASVRILSVCMDHGKDSPDDGDTFTLAKELAPAEVLDVLREWKKNPRIPHDSIQSAVWRRTRPAPPPPPPGKPELRSAKEVLSIAKRIFVLTARGDVFAGEPRRPLRHLPGEVADLWGGKSLFALRHVAAKDLSEAGRDTISRFDPDTAGWADLPLATVDGDLKWVEPDGRFALALDRAGSLVRLAEGSASTVADGIQLLEVSPEGRVYFVARSAPSDVYRLDSGRRATRVYGHSLAIRDLAIAEGVPCILDGRGSALYVGESQPRRLRGSVRFVEGLGHGLLVASADEKNLFFEEKGRLHFYSGDQRLDFPYPVRGRLQYFTDSATRAILCVDDTWVVRQFEPRRNRWTPIAALEAAPEEAPETPESAPGSSDEGMPVDPAAEATDEPPEVDSTPEPREAEDPEPVGPADVPLEPEPEDAPVQRHVEPPIRRGPPPGS